MASGDIDDTLGPEGELTRLRQQHRELDNYLTDWDYAGLSNVVRTCVPYSAGISKDGRTVFIDTRLNTTLNGIDITLALVAHETTEWALRAYCGIGEDYASDPRGHRLANRAEYECVIRLLAGSPADVRTTTSDLWQLYDDFLDPQVRQIERGEVANVDPRLDLYPYIGTSLYHKILEAM